MEILNKDPEEPYFAEVLNLRSGGYGSCDFSMVHSPQNWYLVSLLCR